MGKNKNKTQPDYLDPGPIRHETLPADLLLRIKVFKAILAEVENQTIDETVESFRRDAHPEREVAVWERIASTYQLYLSHNPTDDLAVKRDIFTVILQTSIGMSDGSQVSHLTPNEINTLILNYRGL